MLENTTDPPAEDANKTAFAANTTVASTFVFLCTASKYTFSPPERGNIVPSSSQTNKPQKDRANPRAQRSKDAPTEWTDVRIEDGVENIPVPIMLPTLRTEVRYRWSYHVKVGIHT